MSGQARVAAHSVGTSMARFVLGGIMTVLTARALGPDGRGAYAVLLTIAGTAVSLGHLSIDASHTSLWQQAGNRTAIATNSLLFGLGMGGLSAVGCAVLVSALGSDAVPVAGHGLLALALLTIPCSMTVYYLNSVLVLRERIELVNWSGVLAVGVPCVLLLLLSAAHKPGLHVVVAAWVLSAVLPMAVAVRAVRPRLRDLDPGLARRALGMGLQYHIGGTALFLLLRIDILIINAFSTPAAVGLYAVAVTLMDWTRTGVDAIAQAILPRQLDADQESAALLTARVTRLNALFSVATVGSLCAVAPLLIPLAYGPEFKASVVPLLALAPGLVALAVARVISAFLLRLNRPLFRSWVAVLALVANTGLNLALIPAYGIAGCAVASSISYCLLAGVHLVWFRRATGIPIRALLPGRDEIRYVRTVRSLLVAAR